MKKFLTMVCLALTFLFCGAIMACKGKDDDKNKSALTVEETVSVELTKTYRLAPKLNGEKADDATYESADESIASVSSSGLITGKACGTTNVTVTCQEETATVSVTVALGETVPVLKMTEISGTELNVYVGDELNLSAQIGYGTKTYSDATLTYTVSDPTLGEMDGSKFTALAKGECQVEVSASWRNVPTTLKETVKINVMETMGIEVLENVNVYYDMTAGVLHPQDLLAMFGAADAEVLSASIKTVNAGDDVMSVELASNALTFKKDGEAFESDGTGFTMVLGTSTKQVEVKVTPCKKVFRSAADLDYFVEGSYEVKGSSTRPSYGGYHVLANDIEASAYTAKTKTFGSFALKGASSGEHHDAGFKGVFDGNGYTINGLTVGAGGLFGVIGSSATVKNVGFTNAKINVATSTDKGGVLAGAIYHYAKVENVYIEVVDYGTTGVRGSVAAAINNDAYLKNILVVDNDGKTTDYPVANGADANTSGTKATDYATLLAFRSAVIGQSSGRREILTNQWQNVFMYSTQRMSMFGELTCRYWSLAEKEDLLGGEEGTAKKWDDVANFCAGLTQGTFRYTDWADLKADYTANANESATLYKNASGTTKVTTEWNVKTSVDTFSADFWAYNAETGELSWKGATA